MFADSEAIKIAILNRELDEFVSNEILESIPFAYTGNLANWVEWKSDLAALLQVDPKDVVMIGSAATGFSLNPKKDFKPFDDESDFDCGIVSPYHFDQAWRYLRDQQVGWLSLTPEQKRAIQGHRKRYVFDGTIATDQILHLLPFGNDWQAALELVSDKEPVAGRDVKLRIYRDYQSLRNYHTRGLSYLRDKIISPINDSEEIAVETADAELPI